LTKKQRETFENLYPKTESLKDVAKRAHDYWKLEVAPVIKQVPAGHAVLVSSH
jgi:bisphosphoglycerate-dependent phosphoglycerate mutase